MIPQGLTVASPTKQELRTHKAILLDVSVDAPARAMWLCMKQFNGYFGCGKCKEPGKQLMIGTGKKNVQVHCHIYPFDGEHAINSLGHAPVRVHDEMKVQALDAMSMQEKGKSKVSVVIDPLLYGNKIEKNYILCSQYNRTVRK